MTGDLGTGEGIQAAVAGVGSSPSDRARRAGSGLAALVPSIEHAGALPSAGPPVGGRVDGQRLRNDWR
jgi:hypothetical protein